MKCWPAGNENDDDNDGNDYDEFDLCVMLAGRWWSDSDKWESWRSDYLTVVLSQSQSSDCRPNDEDDSHDDDDDDDSHDDDDDNL